MAKENGEESWVRVDYGTLDPDAIPGIPVHEHVAPVKTTAAARQSSAEH